MPRRPLNSRKKMKRRSRLRSRLVSVEYQNLEERNLLSGNLPAFDASVELAKNFIGTTPDTQYLVQQGSDLQFLDGKSAEGVTTVLFQQTLDGAPIQNAFFTVETANGEVTQVKGSGHESVSNLDGSNSQIEKAFAERLVNSEFADQPFTSSTSLAWSANGQFAWQVDTYLGDRSIVNDITPNFSSLVDATTGELIEKFTPTSTAMLLHNPDTQLGEHARIVIKDAIGPVGSQTYALDFDAVVALPGCTGTLVAPNVVLSARHCGSSAGDSVRFGADSSNPVFTATVSSVDVPAGAGSLLDGGDFNILTLAEDVPASVAVPMRLSPMTNGLEGMLAATVGYGLNGIGSEGHQGSSDGLRWGGENIIELYGEPASASGANIISTDFDNGTAAANTIPSSDSTPLEFEATTAPGDSGGPILVQFGDEWVVAGVLSGGTSSTSVYGDISWWTGVQPYRELIEAAGGVFAEGVVELNQDAYFPGDVVTVTVTGLVTADATVDATLVSTTGDSETLSLTRSGEDFVGTLSLATNSVVINDGELQVTVDDTITASFGGSSDTAIVEQEEILIEGTSGDDVITVDIGESVVIVVNGEEFQLNPSLKAALEFDAKQGNDTITINDGAGNDQTTVGEYFVQVAGFFDFSAKSVEDVTVNSGGGFDSARMFGTDRDDVLNVSATSVSYAGQQFVNVINGYGRVLAFANEGGLDRATFVDSAGSDRFFATPDYANMRTSTSFVNARGFDQVKAFATEGGKDFASFVGSENRDELFANSEFANFSGPGFDVNATGFERATVDGRGGNDVANLVGTDGNDVFFSNPQFGYMYGEGYFNHAIRFESLTAHAGDGNDRANLYDSPGKDTFRATPEFAALFNGQYRNQANGFDRVSAFGSAGEDIATLIDSAGRDRYVGRAQDAYLVGDGFINYVNGFDSVHAISSSGNDIAILHGSREDNRFFGSQDFSLLSGNTFHNRATAFRNVTAYLGNGFDRGRFEDSAGDDTFVGKGNNATLFSNDYFIHTIGLNLVSAVSNEGGTDILGKADLEFELIEEGDWNL